MSLVLAKARTKLAGSSSPRGTTRRSSTPPHILREEGICEPILLGPVEEIRASIEERQLDALEGVSVINPEESPDFERYVARFWELRAAQGHDLRRGAPPAARPQLLRLGDGGARRRRRHGHRPHHRLRRRHPRAARDHRHAQGAPRRRRLHRGHEGRLQVLRRHHREHRPEPAGAGRDRGGHRRPGPLLRRDAAGGHALLLELRRRQGGEPGQGAQGHRAGPPDAPRPGGRRRDPGGHRHRRGGPRRPSSPSRR